MGWINEASFVAACLSREQGGEFVEGILCLGGYVVVLVLLPLATVIIAAWMSRDREPPHPPQDPT